MSQAHEHDAASCPPSAAGPLEPYGARVTIEPITQPLEMQELLIGLLEDLAAACVAEGASLIGHLKCALHTPAGVVTCNFTSARSGASCDRHGEGSAQPLLPGEHARLDLAVLVYGLPVATIDILVRKKLEARLAPLGVSWSMDF